MSEEKIWVEKMPESCSKCLFCYDNRPYWKSTDYIINHKELDEDEIETSVNENCPLQSIHDHDREKDKQIKELEDKIRELQEVDNKRAFRLYAVLYDVLEKQDSENVASRIDYLTGKDYSEMCELYKTAKNLKQHDRALVKEVCEKIRTMAHKVGKLVFCEHCYKTNSARAIDEHLLNEILGQIESEFEQKEYEK